MATFTQEVLFTEYEIEISDIGQTYELILKLQGDDDQLFAYRREFDEDGVERAIEELVNIAFDRTCKDK